MTAVLPALGLVWLLTGCGDAAPGTGPGAATGSTTAPRPAPPAVPEAGACYRLGLEEASAATSDVPSRPCEDPHTARTYLVDRLDRAMEGHLLAVDSTQVRSQVAQACPEALPAFIGGGEEAWRLSVLRAVWFTPSLPESDAGASWFRCDVVALDGRGGLLPLGGRLEGTLATAAGRDRWGLCATGAPDDPDARRVACAQPHSWRAVSVVPLVQDLEDPEDPAYPGEQAASRRGQEPCEQAGRERAADPLDFQWGYEWPTAQQWEAGQRFGRCWVPDEGSSG